MRAVQFSEYGRARAFARPGTTVSARVNFRLRLADGSPLGMVGSFDCAAPDSEGAVAAVQSLLDEACDWLKAESCRAAVGPMTGGAHLPHRFLTSGFETAPFQGEPRNPPAFPRLFEECGFGACRVWESFDLDRPALAEIVARLARDAADAKAGERYRVEPAKPAERAAALRRIHDVLDRGWEGHLGFAPFDPAELETMFAGLFAIMTERHLAFLVDRKSNRDMGFCVFYPDSLSPGRVVAHTVAALPEARRMGGPQALMEALFRNALEDGWDRAVIALVDQDFGYFRKTLRPTREYALLHRAI